MFIFFCFSYFIYLSHALNNGFSVELIHRDSSKSPVYNPTETKFQRIHNAVYRSINRANHFSKQFSSDTNNPVSTLTPDSAEYFMSFAVGTPPFQTYGMIDTGSSLIWLQCLPCYACFNQTSPIFNHSKSSSYNNIHCSSRKCKDAIDVIPSCSQNEDVCEYNIQYGTGINSQGDLSVDTLTLNSTSGSIVVFPNIVIGCGHNNSIPYNGRISGIVGMGSGPISLIQQLGSSIERKFSYCLIPAYNDFGESSFTSKLNFGNDAVVSGKGVVSTPMSKYQSGFSVTLEAISVGNKRIKYEGVKIEGKNTSTRNAFIDSGTPLTLLPPYFHSKLESTAAKMIKLQRIEPPNPFKTLSLCYNTTWEQSNNFPIIRTHFSGADVKLYYNSTFFEVQKGIKCFAFVPSQGDIIFGNFAQHNHLVGYDLKKNVISFKPTDCINY
ncbi:aspartic proteinase CDR1-like [Vicia villosa]|uniref:aspartic proteinase CDR1-like n=1 Tax=Vicia villosa TaxID=3911 RepID=UPI00273B748B|nr:aspartic proteinase CDR1-like [Vicia villosa]